jgi:tRNA pseudouridine(38-40) synthase
MADQRGLLASSSGASATLDEVAHMGVIGGEFTSKNERYTGKSCRKTFAVEMGYVGFLFKGWQKQSASSEQQQSAVEDEVRRLLRDSQVAGAGSLTVAGRTDKGVSACSQVFSFTTTSSQTEHEILSSLRASLASAKIDGLAVYDVRRVPKSFNARSSATWRRYLYLLPLRDDGGDASLDVQRLSGLLSALQRRGELPYDAFSFGELNDCGQGRRDRCTLLQTSVGFVDLLAPASASASSSSTDPAAMAGVRQSPEGMQQPALRIELVGNRFLRRMVRILLATAVLEASSSPSSSSSSSPSSSSAEQGQDEALVDICLSGDRRRAAYPLPGTGLCFAGVGFDAPSLAFYKFQPAADAKRARELLLLDAPPHTSLVTTSSPSE